MSDKHEWEKTHIEDDDIEYILLNGDKLIATSPFKSEIMAQALENDLLKDSFKSIDDFVTAPHLKKGVVIKMRQKSKQWIYVRTIKDPNTKTAEAY